MRMKVALGLAAGMVWTGTLAGPESRGQNFPLSLPTPGVSLAPCIGTAGAQDTRAATWGIVSGDLVVLELESRTLWERTSSDLGATFAAPVHVAGTPLESGIEDFAFVGTDAGTLYVAYLAADP